MICVTLAGAPGSDTHRSFPNQYPTNSRPKTIGSPPGKDVPQQVAPCPEQLDSEIRRHTRQGVLCVANCPVKHVLHPSVELFLRPCESLRQAGFDDGTDYAGELLPRFIRVALKKGLPDSGIMDTGLDIL